MVKDLKTRRSSLLKMLLHSRILLCFIVCTAFALEQDINSLNSNELQENTKSRQKIKCKTRKNLSTDNPNKTDEEILIVREEEIFIEREEKVSIKLYYESLCPFSIDFYTTRFASVVEKLGPYLDITTNPYGNAKTLKQRGKYRFTCQHGPEECYGNKLHACAIDVLRNMTQAVLFNSCMMKTEDSDSSNDKAADECGQDQNINAILIKDCAKGARGTQLLKEFGEAIKKVDIRGVPSIFINGNEVRHRRYFMRDVCAAYTDPPPPCHK